MNKRIVYDRGDGVVAVVTPSPNWRGTIEQLIAKDILPDKKCIVIDADQCPKNRKYRDAWVLVDDAIDIDMTRARDIARDRVRAWRTKQFPELDAQYMMANEKNDQEAMMAVASEKQKLRDLPASPLIAQAQSPAELENFLESFM